MRSFHEVRHYKTDVKIWHREFKSINFIAHWHSEIELIYIIDGDAEIHAAGTSFQAHTGDLIVCDSNDIHYYDGRRDNCRMDFLIFDPAEITHHYTAHNFLHPYLCRCDMEKNGLDVQWHQMASVIDHELSDRDRYFREITRAAVSSFWYRLLRVMPVDTSASADNKGTADIHSTVSRDILTYLEEHYSEPVTLKDAASQAGFSACYFSRYFKRLTGTNFNRYLNLIRISYATDKLSSTNETVTSIALSCGFNNIRTFNRVFRMCTGSSPSEYLSGPHNGLIG